MTASMPRPWTGEYVVGDFLPGARRAARDRPVDWCAGRPGRRGDPAVAVLSWSYWQKRFNRDPSILNKPIVLDGVPATVIGVAPRGFFGLRVGFSPDMWVPAAMEPMIQRPSRRASGDAGRSGADGAVEARRDHRAGAGGNARAGSADGSRRSRRPAAIRSGARRRIDWSRRARGSRSFAMRSPNRCWR